MLQFEDRAFRVVVDEYVTSNDGTGIVHQAPAFGDDDHRIAVANGIIRAEEMPPCPIDDGGRFTRDVYDFEGQHVKVNEYITLCGLDEENLVTLMTISPGC
jgi:isoleucyl-tRNA synthetase